METLNEKIKKLRIQKYISQVDMAKAAGISRGAYLSFENKKDSKNLTLKSAIGIAKALDVSFNELFEIEATGFDWEKHKIEKEKLEEGLLKKNEEISELKKRIEDKESHIDLINKGQYALQFVLMSFVNQNPNAEIRKKMFDYLIQLKVLPEENIERFQTMNESMSEFINQ